jgi:hypothetical protein
MSGQQHAPTAFTAGKNPVPIVQEAGWASGPVWTGGKSRPTGIRSPDLPARSSVAVLTDLLGPHLSLVPKLKLEVIPPPHIHLWYAQG